MHTGHKLFIALILTNVLVRSRANGVSHRNTPFFPSDHFKTMPTYLIFQRIGSEETFKQEPANDFFLNVFLDHIQHMPKNDLHLES